MYLIAVFTYFISVLHPVPRGDSVIFFDDFNGAALDESFWNYELGDGCPDLCGWGNNEPQIYIKENAVVRDGKLIIRATKDDGAIHSARLTTKKKVEFQYGTIEVRAKFPGGRGLWPAIWMLGSDIDTNRWPGCGEIDIMEYVGRNPGVIYNSLHTPYSYGETINSKQTYLESLEGVFHTFKTVWSSEAIKFHIDGKLVYTFSPEEKNTKTWPFDKTFYLLVNMAVGGNFGGPDIDESIFPSEFVIDYIKVTKN